MRLVFALPSAFFAALIAILAKTGTGGVNSNLAAAIRTVAVVAIARNGIHYACAEGTFRYKQ